MSEALFQPRIVFGQDYNSHIGVGIEDPQGHIGFFMIEAYGLVHQFASRETFLRRFSRDLLMEEWVVLCRFLKFALAHKDNEPQAVVTLMKGLEMKIAELKDKSMTELVDMHNELVKTTGTGKPVKKFKSLEVAKIEVIKLANAKRPESKTADATGKAKGGGDPNRPRTGVGARSKELLIENPSRTNKDICDQINKEFPNNQTTTNCIAYYRNHLVKDGKIVKPPKAEKPAKAVKGQAAATEPSKTEAPAGKAKGGKAKSKKGEAAQAAA